MLASKAKDKTKVVVRKLPPAMTEDAFKQVLQGIAGGQHSWLSYYQGKSSAKKLVFSRAYINFESADAVFEFKAKFDGHVFVGTRGTQYKCAVEYAPFQKVPSPEAKKHALEGTIEQDPEYMQFLELLEQGPEMLPSAAAQREANERDGAMPSAGQDTTKGGTVTSRLMEYLSQKYAEAGRLGGLSKAKLGKREQVMEANTAAAAAVSGAWPGRDADEGRLGSVRGAAKPSKLLQREGRGPPKAAEAEAASGRPFKAASKVAGRSDRQSWARSGDGDGAAVAATAAAAAVAAAKHAEQQSVMAVAEAAEGRGGRGRAKGATSVQPLVEKLPAVEAPKMLLMKSGQRKETQATAADHGSGAGGAPVAPAAAPKASGQGRTQAPAAASHGRNAPAAAQATNVAAAAAPSAKAPATRKPAKPAKAEPEAPVARPERSSGASSAQARSSASASQSKAAAVAAPAPAPVDAGAVNGADPAAAAAAAATAALSARPPAAKKVRAGFQAYVPGSMRSKGGGSGGGADTG